MNKINILLGAALLFGFASCDDKSDLGIEQTNPQENIMSADGITLAYGDALAADALDLNNFVDKTVGVINVTEAKDLPENATINMEMQLATDANFTTFSTLKVADGTVKGNDWENAILNMVGKSPLPVDMWIRFAVYADTDADHVRMGGQDFYYAAKKITVTPVDLKLPIENAYYLVLVENGDAKFLPMDHSSRHPYDDPNFSYLLDVTAEQANAGLEWYIVGEKYYQNGSGCIYGVSDVGDPTDMAGSLMEDGEKGIITTAGKIKVEVNMLDLSYNISYAFDYIYTPGSANNWTFVDNMLLSTGDYVNYSGYVYVKDEFKMTGQADWNPLNWGTNDDETLVLGGPNVKVDVNGLYYITVNLNELTFSKTYISQIGLIGGFNNWGGDVVMTPSEDYKVWTADVEATEANTEWKFRMNGEWVLDLGGAESNLTQGGGNLKFAEAGTYTVTLNLGSIPYTCTAVKK